MGQNRLSKLDIGVIPRMPTVVNEALSCAVHRDAEQIPRFGDLIRRLPGASISKQVRIPGNGMTA